MTPSGGPDGAELVHRVDTQLRYLSKLCTQLRVPDPVQRYLSPVVGRWSDLHEEAHRWRAAAKETGTVAAEVHKPLAGLDEAWRGEDAEAFQAYMRTVGLAGTDLTHAMHAMATALDKVADTVRAIVTRLTEVLARAADDASRAMAHPARSTRQVRAYLQDVHGPAGELFEAVRQSLDAFAALCGELHGGAAFGKVTMAHRMPETTLTLPSLADQSGPHPGTVQDAPQAPATPSVDAAAPQDPADTVSTTDADASDAQGAGPTADTGDLAAADTGRFDDTAGPPADDYGKGAAFDGGDGGTAAFAGDHGSAPSFASDHGDAASFAGGSGGAGDVRPPAQDLATGAGNGATAGELPSPGSFSGAADTPHTTAPAAAAPAAAPAAAQGEGGGMPFMPMGPMGGAGRGGDQEYKNKLQLTGDPVEIFGTPAQATQPVIGEDQPPEQQN